MDQQNQTPEDSYKAQNDAYMERIAKAVEEANKRNYEIINIAMSEIGAQRLNAMMRTGHYFAFQKNLYLHDRPELPETPWTASAFLHKGTEPDFQRATITDNPLSELIELNKTSPLTAGWYIFSVWNAPNDKALVIFEKMNAERIIVNE